MAASKLRIPARRSRNTSHRQRRHVLLLLVILFLLSRSSLSFAQELVSGPSASNPPATQVEPTSAVSDPFPHQRAVANEVLSRAEFQRNLSQTWWEEKKRQLLRILVNIFSRVGRLGHASPWLVRSLEWGLFLGAAAALFLFLLRQMARQRLKVDLGTSGIRSEVWTREASDWQQRAEAFATEGAWRDALHCLYWAAIVLLESRKAWRHNPTRTPREYVRLLKPGSAQQQGLRGLTQLFERTWYGLRDVDQSEYARARELYDGLLSPRSEPRSVGREQLEVKQS